MGQLKNSNILVTCPKRGLGIPRCTWKRNIKMCLKGIMQERELDSAGSEWHGMEGFYEHSDEPLSSIKAGNFLTNRVNISFSRKNCMMVIKLYSPRH
jgi:hypothetical protein